MTDLVSALDALRNAVNAEEILRAQANQEWANGVQNGAMKQAHDQIILQVLTAAQTLLNLSKQ
jgi:hypothetical protein